MRDSKQWKLLFQIGPQYIEGLSDPNPVSEYKTKKFYLHIDSSRNWEVLGFYWKEKNMRLIPHGKEETTFK